MKKILLTVCIAVLAFTQGIAQPCSYTRPNISSFSATERLQLRNLIFSWLNTQLNLSYPNGPQRYPLVYMHTMHSSMIHHTGTKAFVTWHRYYLQELENWLMDNGYSKYVPLPYWDPTTCIPNEFYNSASGTSALLDAGFPSLGTQCITPPSLTNYVPPASCSAHTSEDDFSDDMENNYHDINHVAIGGSMGSVTTAPGSAIFWLYHAYIDELWWCYQRNCESLSSDNYIRDIPSDDGTEPSAATSPWYSPDIWTRNTNDGFQNQVSQNLVQTPGATGYVYVRVWNKGNRPNDDAQGSISLYWAKGSTALAWPNPWTGATSMTCGAFTLPLGGFIGAKALRRVNENFTDFTMPGSPVEKDYYIYEFKWVLPDPDQYSACFPLTSDKEHFCLLAKLNDGNPYTMSGNLVNDAQNFNNVAWKNVTIMGDGVQFIRPNTGGVIWGNYTSAAMNNVSLRVHFTTDNDVQLLQNATLTMQLNDDDMQEWQAAGSQQQNISFEQNTGFTILGDDATIGGFNVGPNTYKPVKLHLDPGPTGTFPNTGEYNFDLVQYAEGEVVGGEHYQVVFNANNGAKMASGPTITATPVKGSEDYNVYPNPARNSFKVLAANGMYNIDIIVYDNAGRAVRQFSNVTPSANFNIEGLAAGIYMVKITNLETKQVFTKQLDIRQ